MIFRRRAIFAADVRQLGGIVSVVRAPSARDGEAGGYRINFASGGCDLVFLSSRIPDEDRAITAAEVIAELTGAKVQK